MTPFCPYCEGEQDLVREWSTWWCLTCLRTWADG
jgi:hypothetical protein